MTDNTTSHEHNVIQFLNVSLHLIYPNSVYDCCVPFALTKVLWNEMVGEIDFLMQVLLKKEISLYALQVYVAQATRLKLSSKT